MDKELLQALNNLSESLEKLAETLGKKDEAKSATGSAMQMGNFEKQIQKIHKGITSVKNDTTKLLNQQDTILKLLQKKDGDKSKIDSQQASSKGVTTEPTTVATAKEKKDEKESKISSDKKKQEEAKPSKIKEGLNSILMIAAGIVAIGLAFKLVGKLDVISVLALAAALPLIAIAFAKIANVLRGSEIDHEDLDKKGKVRGKSKTKIAGITLKDLAMVPLAMAAMSFGLMISSPFLSKIQPIGFLQLGAAIGMSIAFSFMIPAFAQMANSLKTYKSVGMNGMFIGKESIEIGTILKAVALLPLVMVALSVGIMMSSSFLGQVKPIGILQLFSVILISAAFALISNGMGQLLGAFKKIDPVTAVKASVLMPLVLVSISLSIMLASVFLKRVTNVGILQALSSILIAGVFTVISYGIAKIMMAFKKIDPMTATKSAILLPLVLVSMSIAIMLSSPFLKNVQPIGIQQALSSIAIAAVFAIVSFSLGKILKSFKKLEFKDIIKSAIYIPIIFTSVAFAMMLSSAFFSKIKPMSFAQFMTILGMSLAFVAIAAAFVLIVKILKYVKRKDVIQGGITILIISVVIAATSQILALGNYSKYPGLKWSLGVGLSLGLFAIGASLIGLEALNPFFYAGLGMILLIAGTVVATAAILNLGKYDKYPPLKWIMPVMLIMGSIGVVAGVLALGSIFIAIGLGVMLLIAGSIYAIDKIFSKGQFKKFPAEDWVNSVIKLFTTIGLTVAGLALLTPLILLGSVAILALAGTVYVLDKIMNKARFRRFPSKGWVSNTLNLMYKMIGLLKTIRKDLGFSDLVIGALKLYGLTQTISQIDKTFSKGLFSKYPSTKWVSGVTSTLREFLKLMKEPSFLTIISERVSSFFGGGLDDLVKVIVKIDTQFRKGIYTKYPSANWVKGVTFALSSFSKLKSFSLFSSTKDLVSVAENIRQISLKLSSGNYMKFPSSEWIKGVQILFKLIDVLRGQDISLLGRILGKKDPISSALSNIDKLAVSFTKLSTALKKFTTSIRDIDLQKLQAIKSLSSNVILLSLMDPKQFDEMMDKLESRAGFLAPLLSDLDASKESQAKSSGTGGAGGMQMVSTGSGTKGEPKGPSEMQILTQKIDLTNGLLRDIASVVGSSGTLKNYLNSLKTEINIGQSSHPSYSKSDSRLKRIIKQVGKSESGINIYLFSYNFDTKTIYQGVIAQELIGTPWESALHKDANGLYSVDYSKIDVDFKKQSDLKSL